MSLKHRRRRKHLEQLQQKLEEWQEPGDDQKEKQARELEAREMARRDLVERTIQEAMESGAFDNLPGKGKPLEFLSNPYLEPGQELANNLLKHNGFAPEWIERDQAIRQEIERLRQWLGRAWLYYMDSPTSRAAAWQAAVERFRADLTRLNRQIDDFNLVVPIISCQRPRLRLEDEIWRVQRSQ